MAAARDYIPERKNGEAGNHLCSIIEGTVSNNNLASIDYSLKELGKKIDALTPGEKKEFGKITLKAGRTMGLFQYVVFEKYSPFDHDHDATNIRMARKKIVEFLIEKGFKPELEDLIMIRNILARTNTINDNPEFIYLKGIFSLLIKSFNFPDQEKKAEFINQYRLDSINAINAKVKYRYPEKDPFGIRLEKSRNAIDKNITSLEKSRDRSKDRFDRLQNNPQSIKAEDAHKDAYNDGTYYNLPYFEDYLKQEMSRERNNILSCDQGIDILKKTQSNLENEIRDEYKKYEVESNQYRKELEDKAKIELDSFVLLFDPPAAAESKISPSPLSDLSVFSYAEKKKELPVELIVEDLDVDQTVTFHENEDHLPEETDEHKKGGAGLGGGSA